MVHGVAPHTVAVLGSGVDEHDDLARPLGELLAHLGVNLLTGGGGGVMRAVARAYVGSRRASGISIGVIPCASIAERERLKPGYPNEYVELPIFTHLPLSGEQGTDDLSRNHINVLSAAAVVALPGSAGTLSEVQLALRYGRPVIAFTSGAFPSALPAEVPRATAIEQVADFLAAVLAPNGRRDGPVRGPGEGVS